MGKVGFRPPSGMAGRRNSSTSTAMIRILASMGRRTGCSVNGGMSINSKAIDNDLAKRPLPTLEGDQGAAVLAGEQP